MAAVEESVSRLDSRLRPLICAAPTMPEIWSRSDASSSWSLPRSTLDSCAAMILSLIWPSMSLTPSVASRAVATDEAPSDSESEIAWKPLTSDSITEEIAQTAALSLAVATFLPVEIWSWTSVRLRLMPLRVWSATIALLLVRMLLMSRSSLGGRRFGAAVQKSRPSAGRSSPF